MDLLDFALEEILKEDDITSEHLSVAAMRAELMRRGRKFSPPLGTDGKLARILERHRIIDDPRAIRSLIEKIAEYQ